MIERVISSLITRINRLEERVKTLERMVIPDGK